MLALVDFPDGVLHLCLSFLANPRDFRALEKSCKRFREILKENTVWKKCCVDFTPQTDCFRDEAFRPLMCERIRQWQRGLHVLSSSSSDNNNYPTSILYSAFTRTGGLSSYMFIEVEQEINPYQFERETFALSGHASSCLMEIVENSLLEQLRSALRLAIHRTPDGVYPSVAAKDFVLQEQVRMEVSAFKTGFIPPATYYPYEEDEPENQEEANRIVRQLAYRAGIAKMENDLYPSVWGTLENLTLLLLRPGCIELADRPRLLNADFFITEGDTRSITQQPLWLEEGQSSHDFAPNPTYNFSTAPVSRSHILVPRHIVDAAKSVGITATVYGLEWHITEATGPRTLESFQQMYCGPGAEVVTSYDLISEVDTDDASYQFQQDEADDESEDEEYDYYEKESTSDMTTGFLREDLVEVHF